MVGGGGRCERLRLTGRGIRCRENPVCPNLMSESSVRLERIRRVLKMKRRYGMTRRIEWTFIVAMACMRRSG